MQERASLSMRLDSKGRVDWRVESRLSPKPNRPSCCRGPGGRGLMRLDRDAGPAATFARGPKHQSLKGSKKRKPCPLAFAGVPAAAICLRPQSQGGTYASTPCSVCALGWKPEESFGTAFTAGENATDSNSEIVPGPRSSFAPSFRQTAHGLGITSW